MEVAANPPAWCGDEQLSLILFEANGASTAALQRALQHIRRAVRGTDQVLVYERMCAIVLPATPLVGAQVVAQRLATLLVEVEYTTQVLYGLAAQTALQRLRALRAVEIRVDVTAIEVTDKLPTYTATEAMQEPNGMPTPARSPAKRRQMTQRARAMLADSTVMSGERSSLPTPTSTHTPALPHLAFLTSYPPLRLFQTFPYALARQYQCVPVGAERGVLTLATWQRLEPDTVAHLQEVTQQTIFQVRCELSLIDDVLRYWERSLLVTVSVSG